MGYIRGEKGDEWAMTNLEITWVLAEIADLLELGGENPFKVKAYRQAVRVLHHLPEPVAVMAQRGELAKLPGFGKTIVATVKELLSTGTCTSLARLREEVPAGLREMLAIPGLGVRSIRTIYSHLGISTLAELEQAAREKRLRTLPGIGTKSELTVLRNIEMFRQQHGRFPLGVALPFANQLVAEVRTLPGVERAEIAGDVRRGEEMVETARIVVGADEPDRVLEVIAGHPQAARDTVREGPSISFRTWMGLAVKVTVVSRKDFIWEWFLATGSRAHTNRVAEMASGNRIPPNRLNSGSFLQEEWEIYSLLGLPYIPPEIRENCGELEAAKDGSLPELLLPENIKGDLHIHTMWSDGLNTIEEMAKAAYAMGYEYLAITDHSHSLAIANGLSVERLQEQWEEIRDLNRQNLGIRLFTGVEVDILADGRLDYPDEVLAQADVVIASIHSGFRQEAEKITTRIEGAMKNPHVDIVAHPTGRMLGRRRPYDIQIERVLDLAARTGTWLEINAFPDRLDLCDKHARQCKDMEIPIVINTDAHDVNRLQEMLYGVITARRGWLTVDDVMNTRSFDQITRVLGAKGKKK